MKILIWLAFLFLNGLITALLNSDGILLGFIPTALLFGATMWAAKSVCKLWDESKENRRTRKAAEKVVQEAISAKSVPDQIHFCRKCGEQLLEDSRFCRKCGCQIETDLPM